MMAVTAPVWRVVAPRRAGRVARSTCGIIRLRARGSFPRRAPDRPPPTLEVPHLAKTPRTWTGARTPSGLKRVRQAERRREVLQPRRSAAKTYVAKALTAAAAPAESNDRSGRRARRGAQRARSRRQGRCHPPERRRPPQVAPDPQGQRRARWRARPDRWPRRQDDRQGRRGEGRQGPHRRRQGRQGQGRPDRRRQGPRRAEQDGPRRGSRREGSRRRGRVRRGRPAKADRDEGGTEGQGRAPKKAADRRQGRAPRRPRRRRPRPRPRRRRRRPRSSSGRTSRPIPTTTPRVSPGRFNSGPRDGSAAAAPRSARRDRLRPEDPVQRGSTRAR